MTGKSTWKLKDREIAHITLALSWLKELDNLPQGKVFGHDPMTKAEILSLIDRFSATCPAFRESTNFSGPKVKS